MPYREKKIYSGAMLEVERVHSTIGGRVIGRRPKEAPTGEAQARINLKNAKLRLSRLMCCNFTRGDLFLGLTYEVIPTEEQQTKDLQKFLRWLRKECRKLKNEDLKYIWVREDRGVRPHYHLVCQDLPLTMADIREKWAHGRVSMDSLDGNPDYGWLARYLTKQEDKQKNKKRWGQSRNLAEPYEKKKILKRKALQHRPKAPKGYYCLSYYHTATAAGYEWEKMICIREDRLQALPEDVVQELATSKLWAWGGGAENAG